MVKILQISKVNKYVLHLTCQAVVDIITHFLDKTKTNYSSELRAHLPMYQKIACHYHFKTFTPPNIRDVYLLQLYKVREKPTDFHI